MIEHRTYKFPNSGQHPYIRPDLGLCLSGRRREREKAAKEKRLFSLSCFIFSDLSDSPFDFLLK